MRTRIVTVLFDLGGVVCHFRPERRLHALASGCGLSELEVRARVWDSGFDRDCDLGRHTAQEVYEQLRARLGLEVSETEFRRLWALAFEPDPAVLSLVDSLRSDVRVGLLTDNGPVLREAMPLLFPEITSRFEPLLFSCELGALKPAPELFAGALARLNQCAEHVLLVDDSPRVVQGATAFGLHGCLYDSREAVSRELARYELCTDSR